MPVADASRIASGLRHALLLLVLTGGLMVLGVLFAGTARADERDTAGDAIGALVRDAGEATGNDDVAAGRDDESAQRDDDEGTERDDKSTERDTESTERDDKSTRGDAESESGEGATDPAVDSTETVGSSVRPVSQGTGASSEVSEARDSAGRSSSDPGYATDNTADPPVTDIARNASDTTTTDADTARDASYALDAPGDLVTNTTGEPVDSRNVPGDPGARVASTTGEAAGGIDPLGDLVMGTAGGLTGVVEPPGDPVAGVVGIADGGVPGALEAPVDLVAGVVGIADGGVLGALEAPVDLVVGTADEVSAVLETPGDLVAAVVETGSEAVAVLGATITITTGTFSDGGLAEVTVAVAVEGPGTGARLVDARPGTTSGEPGAGLPRGYLPRPAPAGETVLPRPSATGDAPAMGTPAHAAAPCGGPGLLAYSGGNVSGTADVAPTDGAPLRPLASLPVTAPAPSPGGGSGFTSALLPVAAMVVPPALSRRFRHARDSHLASLCPSPGERPG